MTLTCTRCGGVLDPANPGFRTVSGEMIHSDKKVCQVIKDADSQFIKDIGVSFE